MCGQLPARAPELRAQDVRVRGPHELAERLHERAVRRAHHRVARADQHEHALLRDLLDELAHEPALPGAGLAADERDPPALARRVRNERAQRHELARAADERRRSEKEIWLGHGSSQI